jgi:DNA-binding beta-propeller fold protein YncE
MIGCREGRMKWIVAGIAGLCSVTCPLCAGEKAPPEYLSPHVLAAGSGDVLFIGLATSNKLLVFDLADEKVADEIALPHPSSGMVLSPDASRLYVTAGTRSGEIYTVDTRTHEANLLAKVGHTPTSPVLSPDGKTLYVCTRFYNDVAFVDVLSGRILKRTPVQREPVAAALTPDGSRLIVANHLPAGRSDEDHVAAAVSMIDTKTAKAVDSIALPNGSTDLQDLCLSPDGRYAYVTHILGRHQLPTTQIQRGWINTNALTVIDLDSGKRVNTVLLDDVDLGAANPCGVECTADGKHLAIALSGTHELCLIDREGLHERLSQAAAGDPVTSVTRTAGDVPNDFSFLVGLKQRVKLPGKGPRGLAIVGTKVFVTEYFTDSLAVVELEGRSPLRATPVLLQAPVALSEIRRGELLFHDAEVCFQNWQSCASCHPGSGRTDALNWDLLNDGIGNPKNTKSLLLAHRTPPSMSLGARETAETAVRAGIRYIHFTVRPESDAVAIDRYLESLEPVASPHLVDGKPGPAAVRGEQVFRDAGCASCHNGPFYTNGKPYDVGTGLGTENSEMLDTPTLIEVWRTAPYLHDGRATTIREVLTTCNPDDEHGRTSHLTDEQLDDLAEFVLTR